MGRWSVARSRIIPATLWLPLALLIRPALAQTSLVGLVRDSAGHPIAGAEIAIEALSRLTHTDDAGHYMLADITPGMRLVRVRRVGYVAFSRMTQVAPGDNTLGDITLAHVIVTLDTVTTRKERLARDEAMREFEENRKLGLGHFVTQAKLDSMRGHPLADLLQQIPGTRIVTSSNGSASYIISSSRGLRSLENNQCPEFEDAIPSGAGCADCYPLVYVDGVVMSGANARQVPNINRFAPQQIEAIEVYAGPAETPPKYAGLGSQCGVVLIHTRWAR